MNKNENGFTLIELIVVMLIVSVLTAIAAPNWLALSNKQKLNAATEKIYLYLQDGKNKAQQQNRAYRVSFRNDNGVPQVAVNLERNVTLNPSSNRWENLSEGSTGLTFNLTDGASVIFNHDGTIRPPNNPSEEIIMINVNESIKVNMVNQASASQRCIVVSTVLGSLRKAEGENCN